MTPRRFSALGSVAILLALLALAQAHFALGLFGTLRRTVMVSWDNPATQAVDELACQSLPHTDPSREASEHAVLAARPCGKILARGRVVAASVTLPSRLTRSPPSA